MFVEPLAITIDSVAQTFNRTGFNPSTLQTADGSLVLSIAHSVAKSRERSSVRLERSLTAPDALNPSVNRMYKTRYGFWFETGLNGIGISDIQAEKDIRGLMAWAVASTNLTKLFGKES